MSNGRIAIRRFIPSVVEACSSLLLLPERSIIHFLGILLCDKPYLGSLLYALPMHLVQRARYHFPYLFEPTFLASSIIICYYLQATFLIQAENEERMMFHTLHRF